MHQMTVECEIVDSPRRFAVAAGVGGAVPLAAFALLVGRSWLHFRDFWAAGGLDLGRFFDVQALAWRSGRWNVPRRVVGFDGFLVHGKTYIYFGAFPALLRLPILFVAPSTDGRLTPLSMTVAYVLAVFASARLLWRARRLVRPGARFGRVEWWATAVWVFAAGSGALLYQGVEVWVYHEAVLWAVALALLGLDAVAGYLERPTSARLIGAAALASCAMLSRPSVGFAPAAALGAVALVRLLRSRADTGEPDSAASERRRSVRAAAVLAVAAAVPVVLYLLTNLARFGSPVSVPFDRWVEAMTNPAVGNVVRADGGTLVSVVNLPTTTFHYFRPDALSFAGRFPFIGFPGRPASLFGAGMVLALGENPTSVVDVMPGLLVLAAIGWWALVRGRLPRDARTVFVPVALGAAAAIVPTLLTGTLSNRYLGDFVPFAVVPAAVGLEALLRRSGRNRPSRAALAALLSALVLFGACVSFALAIDYQRTVDRVVRRPDAPNVSSRTPPAR